MGGSNKFWLALFILAMVLFTGCAKQQEEPIIIGISTILTGDFAALGDNIVKSAELALEQTPHEGLDIRFAVEDAGCGGGEGLTVARKLVETNGVQAIIGGTCSGDTLAAAPFVNERQIPYLTPVTGGRNIDEAGEYVFRTGNSDLQAGIQPANDFIEIFGFRRVALVSDQADYTLDIRNTFKEHYEELGGEVVLDETTAMETRDFRTLLLRIQELDPDAIMFSSQLGTTGGYFIRQARELGIETPIFTTFTTVASSTGQEIAGEAMEGIYFYDPAYAEESAEWQAFLESYQEKYGQDPFINFHSAATHDTVQMLVSAIKEVGNDGERIHDWLLSNVDGWQGLSGSISLDEQGNVDTGFTLKVVQNGSTVLYGISS